MGARLGLEGITYLNTGTYPSPVLVEVQNIKDLTLSLEKGTADVTTRGSATWRQMIGAIKDATIDFQMVWNTSDSNFTAIQTAFLGTTVATQSLEFFFMSCDIVDADSQGLRTTCMVEKFTKNEPLEEAQTVDVSLRPTISTYPPQWVTGGPYTGFGP